MARFTRHLGAVIFSLAILYITTPPAFAGPLTGVSISASNNDAGVGTVYTISFTTSADIPANGRLVIGFPGGFDLSGVSLASNISGLTGGYSSITVLGQSVTLQRDGTGNTFNGGVTLRIAEVGNHTVAGSYDISVETQDGSGVNIDGPDNDGVNIEAGPLDYFLLSVISSPQTAGEIFSFTVSAFDAFDNPTSFNGALSLSDNTSTLTPASVAMSGATATVSNANITKAQSGVQIIVSGGGKSVVSNLFTVNPGSTSYVKIIEGPSGDGAELTTKNLTADQSLMVHAAGYDANDNYTGDVSVSWGSTGTLAPALSSSGTNVIFNPTTAPASGTVTADHPTAIDDATGTVSISDGAPYRVKILDGANGQTTEVTTQGLTTGGALTVHASSFDADDNYLADVSVTWSVSGGIGTIPAGPSANATFTATTPGTGQINATHASLIGDATGAISVNAGNLSYVKIIEGPSGNGAELTTKNLSADEVLTMHAAGYDASDNYLGDFTVTWASTGTLAPALIGSSASITFNPTTAPASGTITANHATATDDATGTISVSDGALHHVLIRTAANGGGSAVGAQVLTADQNLTMHAAGYDADNNFISDVGVTWAVNGGIGSIGGSGTSVGAFNATTAGSGFVTADHASAQDGQTGLITVTPGAIASLRILSGSNGETADVTSATLTADESLTLHTGMYDGDGNYIGDNTATWSSSGLTPSVSGTSTSIIFNPTTSGVSGTITATRAGAGSDNVNVTVNDGAALRVKVLSGASGATSEVTSQSLTTGGTLVVHASSFDADDNYITDVSVTWSVSGGIGTIPAGPSTSATFSATTPGSGQINANHASLIDGVTGTITVTAGSVSYVKIVEGPIGNGAEFTTRNMTADETLTLHAAGYDASNNYLGDFAVTWGRTGNLAPAPSGSSTSIIFSPTNSPASGTITADHATATDDATGTIAVSDGAPYRVKILSGASGSTSEITTANLTTGGTLQVHASSFDADDNYIADLSVTWSVSGGIGTIPAGPSVSATFSATTPGSGQINADHASLIDGVTGTITVTAGSVSYVKIVEGPNGDGAEFTTRNMTADETLTLHAAGYDASNNYLGDFSVTWSSTGTLAPAVSSSGTSVTFNPTTAPASGTITANHATATDDVTGTISVSDGAPARIKVLSALSGETTEVTNSTLTPGGTLPVHASSFDADGNYITDASVTWSVSGGIGTIPAGPSTSATFTATTVGTGTITATHSTLGSDATGTITVNPGGITSIKLRTAPNNGGAEFGAFSMTSDDSVMIFAASYDAGNTYLGEVNVTWSRTGTLAPVSGSGTSLNFRPTTAPASGTIVGTHASAGSDATGTITVSTGKPSGSFSLTPNPASLPADNTSQSTVTSSALRDRDNNLVGSGKKFTITISGLSDLTIATPDADLTLNGHQIATDGNSTLIFSIEAGLTGGSATITAISVDNGLTSSTTTLVVGSISVLAITAPQTVSQGQQDVPVSMSVKNIGSTQLTEVSGSLAFRVGAANRNSQYNVTPNPSNPTTIPGNATATLSYLVDVNSAPSAETVTIDGTATGKVSGTPVTDVDADTPDAWAVQTPAALMVQSVSTMPTVVSRGQVGIVVNVAVRNNFGATASANASIDSVRLVLKSGATVVTSQYTISQNAGNPTSIAGGAEATFSFTVNVSVAATLGTITVDARAHGKDVNSLQQISDINGAASTDSWSVVDAGVFNIVSLTPSQASVTAGMTKTWTVTMEIQNGSQSNITMNFSPSRTRIRLAVGSDTTGWTMTQPVAFNEGGQVLSAGQIRHLNFTITQTANKIGTATISGFAGGTDNGTGLPVNDTTIDGGTGEVAVQSAGNPLVNAVTPSQPTVTAGQSQDWNVVAAIFNNGGSTLKYNRTQSSISIANGVGYTIVKPTAFTDGDSLIDGFETKSLSFRVDVTGTQTGVNLPIAVNFKGDELNSATLRTSNTFNGQITVQTTALLQVQSTTMIAPNGQSINVGQSFIVNVQVNNLGQEVVDSLRVRLITNGGSTILPPNNQLIQNLIGLSQPLSFNITAGPVNANERFTASILSSRAHNTQQSAAINSPAPDDTVRARVQNPSALQVQVSTSVATVAAGQTNPTWRINLRVTNSGGAPLQLNPPSVSNIDLKILGVTQTDYAIIAPTALKLGGLTLQGGQSDTLIYVVNRTGEIGGTVAISATIGGFDKNDNNTRSASGNGSVTVTSTAAVRLTEVSPVVIRTSPVGVGFVNKSQNFSVRVRVENPSLEAVRDVRVSLNRNRQSFITPANINIASIAAGANALVTFNVTAGAIEVPDGETFEAEIDQAFAATSGTPARKREAADSTAIIVIQSRAHLKLTATTDDPDGILTTSQVFELRAKVENLGQAPYDNDGQIQLTIPSGYQRVIQDPLTRSFSEGETVVWTLRAPSNPSGPDNFTVTIVDAPKDRNTDANAFVEQNVAQVAVRAEFTDLAITKLEVSAPAGGEDGVLSTDQFFDVTANIAISANLVGGTATLSIPQGYSFRLGPQDAVRNTISETMTWQLQAPPDEHAAPLDVTLDVVGRDQQNQTISDNAAMPVRTVRKASLAVNARISAPPGAIGGQLSVNQTFYVRVELNNDGTAQTTGTARVRINFGATGVTTQDTLVRVIAVDDTIQWELKAPSVQTARTGMTISLETPFPLDENTGVVASAPQSSRTVQVGTGEQGSVTVSDVRTSFPSGAQDGIISTGQSFQVTATLAWQDAVNLEAELQYPADFRTATPRQIPSSSQLTWDVIAPSFAIADQPIRVVFRGTDSRNPNLALTDDSSVLNMQVVRRAELRLDARIVSPTSATDGTVSVGQNFLVEGVISNTGQAQVVGSDGISITLPDGYTTQEPALKSSSNGKVQWMVRARDTRSVLSNESIRLALEVRPRDENSNDEALVSQSEDELPIFTEPKQLVVRNLPRRATTSVAQGEQRVSLLGLEMENSGDPSSSNIIVRGLRLTVRDRAGEAVAPNTLLAGLRVQGYNNAAKFFGAPGEIPATNPIVVNFAEADTVRAGGRDSLEVIVDLASSASLTSFSISLEDSSDIDAIDQDSPLPVEIVDGDGRTGTAFEVSSDFSVVIESDFAQSFRNYPNPFGRPDRLSTTFVYNLPADSDVELHIYSLLGELVWKKAFKATDPEGLAGKHDGQIQWDGKNGKDEIVLNGIYIAMLKTNSGTVTAKVAFIK